MNIRKWLYVGGLLAGAVIWGLWFYWYSNLNELLASWKTGLTMLFGSFVAGSTPLGGGAVAFPVFTKVLDVTAQDARAFSLFIQSVGMSFAVLYFVSRRIFIDWNVIVKGLVFAVLGQICASFFPLSDGLFLKYLFTCFLLFVAILLLQERVKQMYMPEQFRLNSSFMLTTFIGGLISGYLGAGADTLLFFFYIVLLGSCAKPIIPTTVTFMALNAIVGSGIFFLQGHQPSEFVANSWFFAAPIVAIGAPLGGSIMTKLKPALIVGFVVLIILMEAASSLVLLPLNLLEKAVVTILISCLVVAILLKNKQLMGMYWQQKINFRRQ
ncbi:hypothetical protein PSECIP111951_02741 [Pseudoalteromonas holothuriae]|uniref:Probable membrane transporter protein n=1 Tax=Pseudoalteromonas holothuriae TaxID=2963714 RepID=A0A9W4W2V7_9GAMM|nr:MULTISPECIES: sulfite exporter TauE/SafE family protein [unclassified Pseudoalteromonas]CAH9055143.1 hypothetical protein PSECIP111854_01519 [Pseudoalteromonas sp. CIP111854]CAH9062677.1 hypothetical protein PSECIP111951_02741 [Pseudoalteromonas sp. CIP111951]